jgi:MraZ protein
LEREHLFRGSALNAVDAKGRLSVPSFIRQKVERRSDEKLLVLSLHSEFPCLVGYDANYSATMQDKAERRLGDNPDPLAELDLQASLFAGTVDVPYDPSAASSCRRASSAVPTLASWRCSWAWAAISRSGTRTSR